MRSINILPFERKTKSLLDLQSLLFQFHPIQHEHSGISTAGQERKLLLYNSGIQSRMMEKTDIHIATFYGKRNHHLIS